MKLGRTIQELAKELDRQNKSKEDYLVDTTKVRMESYNGTPLLHVLDNHDEDIVEPLDIRQTAHEQIGAYLSIPRKYYDRMRNEDPELLAYNVNRWFGRNPEQRMIRTLDGHARAFLSNRYRRIDNFDIAQITLPIIADMPDATIESCEVTENAMFIKAVNPRLTTEVSKGDRDPQQRDRAGRGQRPSHDLPPVLP